MRAQLALVNVGAREAVPGIAIIAAALERADVVGAFGVCRAVLVAVREEHEQTLVHVVAVDAVACVPECCELRILLILEYASRPGFHKILL